MAATDSLAIPIKFPFVHVVLSHFTVMFCTICFFEDEKFLRTSKLHSPILLILMAGELVRWLISKYLFGLDAANKDSSYKIVAHISNFCKLSGLLVIFIVAYMAICILMGASYVSNYEETLTLSILLTLLTILPIGLFLGPTQTMQYLCYETFELSSPLDVWQLKLLQYNAFGTLVGAWTGSIVMPLDWDRAWQAYPIPNMVGAIVGFIFANIHTFLSSIVHISDRMMDRRKVPGVKKTV